MTPSQIFVEIFKGITTSWATCTPIKLPNRSFDPPAGSWIEPIVDMGDTFIGELGDDGIGMRTGLVAVNVNILPDKGYKVATDLAGRLETYLRRADIGGVIFDDPATTPAGVVEGYYRVITRVPFHAWIGE